MLDVGKDDEEIRWELFPNRSVMFLLELKIQGERMNKVETAKEFAGSRQGRIGNRPFWVLALSIVIRAVHQVGAAVFLASFLLDEISSPPALYFAIVVISGGALMVTEGMRHRQFYREFSGVSIFVKLIILGAAYHGLLPGTATVVLITFFMASLSSHMPKFIRHRLLY